ncbi:hypothetical protein P8452_01071 [Trifolium repens]|nr:hypothetical protein P8452_01071 [Trifolium repens]
MLLHFHNAVNEGDHAPQVANELVPPAVVNIEHRKEDQGSNEVHWFQKISTYLNRFTTCLLFGSLEVLALAMVTFQAASDHLHPNACEKSSCMKGGIGSMFYTSLSLLALAIGLILGAITGVTGVVWVSTQRTWYWGFFIITIASSIGFVTLSLGKSFYRIKTPGDSPTIRIAQVIVLAIINQKLRNGETCGSKPEMNETDAVELVAYTAMHCVHSEGKDRPTISDIVANLERAFTL